MTMDLRLLIAELRWGDSLTKGDREFIKEMTLCEVFGSSYLLAKTRHLQTSRTILRR